ADLRNQDVARVACAPLGGEAARQRDLAAVALPVDEAAGERDRPLVAELRERLRGERRALAGRAVEDDRGGAIGHAALDPGLQAPARDVDRARDVALVPLVVAAGVDLLDLRLRLLEKFPVARHSFKNDSSARRYSR